MVLYCLLQYMKDNKESVLWVTSCSAKLESNEMR